AHGRRRQGAVFQVGPAFAGRRFPDVEIVTVALAATVEVVIVNTGEAVAPAATVTEAGTPTPGSLLNRFTTSPPAGAGPVRFTLIAVADTPPPNSLSHRARARNAAPFT